PIHLTSLVGREDVVAEIAGRLSRRRLITIVGTGGIGKTRVAVAVAAKGQGDGEAVFADLATVADPSLVAGSLASALGLPIMREDPVPQLIRHLRDRRMLLVLDNCEHVVEAAAVLAEQLLGGAPEVRILATSREPLRADGENVYRLPPLATPPASPDL